MLSLHHPVRVFLHTKPTDLRKSFDALAGPGADLDRLVSTVQELARAALEAAFR